MLLLVIDESVKPWYVCVVSDDDEDANGSDHSGSADQGNADDDR